MDNSITANETEVFIEWNIPYWELILLAVLIQLIAIAGIIGNSMIIVAVSFSRKLQTSTNAFVTSLAVADLLTSFFLIWFSIGVLGRTKWPIPQAHWICEITGFMIFTSIGTSMYNLAAIAVNRLVLITKRSLYQKIFSSWKLAILVAIPWIVPGGSVVVVLLTGNGAFGYDSGDMSCSAIDSHEQIDLFYLCVNLVGIPLPFLAITVSYVWIYVFLKRHFRAQKMSAVSENVSVGDMGTMTRDTHCSEQRGSMSEVTVAEFSSGVLRKQKISNQQIEITKNLFMIVCAFFACFAPFFILLSITEDTLQSFQARLFIQLAPLANSTINFAIYARKHPDFKVVFGHMMRRSYADIPQPSRFLRFLLSKK